MNNTSTIFGRINKIGSSPISKAISSYTSVKPSVAANDAITQQLKTNTHTTFHNEVYNYPANNFISPQTTDNPSEGTIQPDTNISLSAFLQMMFSHCDKLADYVS